MTTPERPGSSKQERDPRTQPTSRGENKPRNTSPADVASRASRGTGPDAKSPTGPNLPGREPQAATPPTVSTPGTTESSVANQTPEDGAATTSGTEVKEEPEKLEFEAWGHMPPISDKTRDSVLTKFGVTDETLSPQDRLRTMVKNGADAIKYMTSTHPPMKAIILNNIQERHPNDNVGQAATVIGMGLVITTLDEASGNTLADRIRDGKAGTGLSSKLTRALAKKERPVWKIPSAAELDVSSQTPEGPAEDAEETGAEVKEVVVFDLSNLFDIDTTKSNGGRQPKVFVAKKPEGNMLKVLASVVGAVPEDYRDEVTRSAVITFDALRYKHAELFPNEQPTLFDTPEPVAQAPATPQQ